MADPRIDPSPVETYHAHCRRGELAYQYDRRAGRPVFPPRVAAPGTGATDLEWRISAGLGTVHATTTVHRRDEPACNVAMIDMDEGFRLMARVEQVAPEAVAIGLRVELRMAHAPDDEPPYPVFVPLAEEGS